MSLKEGRSAGRKDQHLRRSEYTSAGWAAWRGDGGSGFCNIREAVERGRESSNTVKAGTREWCSSTYRVEGVTRLGEVWLEVMAGVYLRARTPPRG